MDSGNDRIAIPDRAQLIKTNLPMKYKFDIYIDGMGRKWRRCTDNESRMYIICGEGTDDKTMIKLLEFSIAEAAK